MDKLAVLTLMGDLSRGIEVIAKVCEEGGRDLIEEVGWLPPQPDLVAQYERWQSILRSLAQPGFRIKGKVITTKDNSAFEQFEARQLIQWCRDCSAAEQELSELMNNWLLSESFLGIRDKLNETISTTDRARVLLRSLNPQVKKLPWNLWNWLSSNQRQAEVILSTPRYQPRPPILRKKVRILIVLGTSEGINPETDLQLIINQLGARAEIIPLINPTRQQLTDHLWEQPIDIFFFAGHSETDSDIGRIYLNDCEVLEINDLKHALQRAIDHGLKLAIFNSCDGLGLAYALENLHIPNLIVMREIVHEKVAQHFLSQLLVAFVIEKKPLHLAEREARLRLEGLEGEFPCASWMPVIFQTSVSQPQFWQDWFKSDRPRPWGEIFKVAVVSFVVAVLIMWVRSLGVLEPSELWAYDRFMELRPQNEVPDPRLLIVGVTKEDLHKWGEYLPKTNQIVFSNQAMIQLIKAINKSQPRLIGLDIVRDKEFFESLKGYAELIDYLKQQDKRIISICKIAGKNQLNYPEAAPPQGVLRENVGYINFANNPGEIVRNHSISREVETGECAPKYSLSLLLALRFLGQEEINITSDSLSIGTHLIKTLSGNSGGYQTKQSKDDIKLTNPILLNYRATDKVAEQVTVTKVLNGSLDPNLVKDKIVLIGYDDGRDEHYTPYSYQLSGVVLHAHMVSQLIGFIKERRPLIQPLAKGEEIFWIFGWALTGGILAWQFRLLRLKVSGGIGFIILCIGSFWLFNEAVWVPFIPASLAFIGTGSMMIIYIKSPE